MVALIAAISISHGAGSHRCYRAEHHISPASASFDQLASSIACLKYCWRGEQRLEAPIVAFVVGKPLFYGACQLWNIAAQR
jgi:hypothetical protein